MPIHPVLINGQWRAAASAGSFHAENPATGETLADEYPISQWADVDAALTAAVAAAETCGNGAAGRSRQFLTRYAERLERGPPRSGAGRHQESGLAGAAAAECRTAADDDATAAGGRGGGGRDRGRCQRSIPRTGFARTWPRSGRCRCLGRIIFRWRSTAWRAGILSRRIAAGMPGDRARPTRRIRGRRRYWRRKALAAVQESGVAVPATVQLLYRTSHEDGARVRFRSADGRMCVSPAAATAGLTLKAAADAAGKPIYLELSSVNPVLILPGALEGSVWRRCGGISSTAC